MSDVGIREIELNITEAKKFVELGKSLDRLNSNPDFIAVVREAYLRDEAVRLVHLRSDPSLRSPEMQAAVLRDIDAIGSLTGFFQKVTVQADMAAQAIDEGERTIEEILAEEAEA